MAEQEPSLTRFLEDSGLLPFVFENEIVRERPVSKEEAISLFRNVLQANPLLIEKAMGAWSEKGAIDDVLRHELLSEWVKEMSRQEKRGEGKEEKCDFCSQELPGIASQYRLVVACENAQTHDDQNLPGIT